MSKKKITSVIVGAGHRAILYSKWALSNPDMLQIIGVVEPNPTRRKEAADLFRISDNMCFETVEGLVARGKLADSAINGTMDKLHVRTSLPLLHAGYDILLEKPICTNQEDLKMLLNCTKETKRKVMICHILRYAPFYVEIKKRLLSGEIGKVLNMETAEQVSYHHMSAAFIRGKWNNKEDCGSSMLMAKCCHDFDLIIWLMHGINPVRVSSFGSLRYFNQKNAPENSGTRCLVDCPIEAECEYSAKKIYIDAPDRWGFYVWASLEANKNITLNDKIDSLKTGNPHGRCIWKCDNNVVDHQSVLIEFEDGTTVTHNMIGGTSKPGRKLHIIGSEGEIQGWMEEGKFVIRKFLRGSGCGYSEENIDVETNGDMHGGGDMHLVEDFVKFVRGDAPSISTTNIEDSITGHILGFKADEAMDYHRVITL